MAAAAEGFAVAVAVAVCPGVAVAVSAKALLPADGSSVYSSMPAAIASAPRPIRFLMTSLLQPLPQELPEP